MAVTKVWRIVDPQDRTRLEELLGHSFSDPELLEQALTHASLADHRLDSNERLEFLGDSVLGLVVCDYLFDVFDHLLEGDLTKIKSTIVSRTVCAEVSRELQIEEWIRLGKGMSNRNALPGSVVAAIFEALIGALFIDGGLEPARKFIIKQLESRIFLAAESGHQSNFKSVLQQTAQQVLDMVPQYIVLDEQGPDHAKCFEVCVELGSNRYSSSWGASKKQSEQQAALHALLELNFASQDESGQVIIRNIDELCSEHRTSA